MDHRIIQIKIKMYISMHRMFQTFTEYGLLLQELECPTPFYCTILSLTSDFYFTADVRIGVPRESMGKSACQSVAAKMEEPATLHRASATVLQGGL
jgi:hypothetical protein